MILILDMNNIAFRANKINHLTTKQGEPVGAIYGSLQMIQSYIKPSKSGWKNGIYEALKERGIEDKFTRVVACWDYGKSEYRTKLYSEYKAQRKERRENFTPEEKAEFEEFIKQINELHEILPSFGIHSLRKWGWEADDLIYTVTKATDDICVIVSTDRDLLQIVSDRIFIWTKETLITPENFEEIVGVPKKFYMDYRVLVGDPSDNIKGVPGIGEKTAKSLIATYGGIPNMIKYHKEALMKSKRTAKIFENLDVIERNAQIMVLNRVPLDEILPFVETELAMETNFDEGAVKSFFMKKQFASMLRDFINWSMPFKSLK